MDRFFPKHSSFSFDFVTKIGKQVDEKPQFASKFFYQQSLAAACNANFKNPNPNPNPKYNNTRIRSASSVPKYPELSLEAAGLIGDPFTNILDWSVQDVVAIGVNNCVSLWAPKDDSLIEITEDLIGGGNGPVMSVSWSPDDGATVAVGLSGGGLQLWDFMTGRFIRSLHPISWIGSVDWKDNNVVSSGLTEGVIIHSDVRMKTHVVGTCKGHTGEVCRLKWSQSGNQLASGGTDHLIHIWNASSMSMSMSSSSRATRWLHRWDDHKAAITALSWCPFKSNLIASSAGLGDHCIKFWDTRNGAPLDSVDTKSEVSCLIWNKHEKELLSSHGKGSSNNLLTLWSYPSMLKITEFNKRSDRVLFMAQSPDGYSVATAGADESLMVWKNVFGAPPASGKQATGKIKREPFSDSFLIRRPLC